MNKGKTCLVDRHVHALNMWNPCRTWAETSSGCRRSDRSWWRPGSWPRHTCCPVCRPSCTWAHQCPGCWLSAWSRCVWSGWSACSSQCNLRQNSAIIDIYSYQHVKCICNSSMYNNIIIIIMKTYIDTYKRWIQQKMQRLLSVREDFFGVQFRSSNSL